MAKTTIGRVLRIRSGRRILTTLASLAVIFFFSQLIIKNPSLSQAESSCDGDNCTINESGLFAYSTGQTYFSVGGVRRFTVTANTNLTISGASTVVELYTPLNISELTVKEGATVTHSAILSTDVGADRFTLLSTGVNKKVIITATTVRLETGGSIDVSGKGFPGGIYRTGECNGCEGFGLGRGLGAYAPLLGGGFGSGAGHGGVGGYGYSTTHLGGGNAYGDQNNPSQHGSGGGAGRNLQGNGSGGNGGGIVEINAGTLYLDGSSSIKANGSDGASNRGGGGSGGSIKIIATTVYGREQSFSVAGDTTFSSEPPTEQGAGGTIILAGNTTNFGNVTAKGGTGPNNAGGGAGGRIYTNITTFSTLCRITSGDPDYIPAACEGQNVVIDGFGTSSGSLVVYADKIRVWNSDLGALPPGEVDNEICSSGFPEDGDYNSTDLYNFPPVAGNERISTCDSKRSFASLTIANGAVLTHKAVTVSNMTDATGNSLAGVTTGHGRWKKVDIEVDDELRLESGAKIDVNEKGYPGNGIREYIDGIRTAGGYGPGGGLSGAGVNGGRAGGGSYGGRGEIGNVQSGPTYGNALVTRALFEFGSGGGTFHEIGSVEDYSWNAPNGGAGGGRIWLKSERFYIASDSKILANGKAGQVNMEDDNNWSGSGSGGSIVVEAAVLPVSLGLSVWGANNGTVYFNNTIGEGNSDPDIGQSNIIANGGSHEVDGGGGRILITAISEPNVTIKKTLEAVSRPGANPPNYFNPYALRLGDVIDVVIELTNLNDAGSLNLEDEALDNSRTGTDHVTCARTTNPTSVCGITGNDINGTGITVQPNGNSSCTVIYRCQVQ